MQSEEQVREQKIRDAMPPVAASRIDASSPLTGLAYPSASASRPSFVAAMGAVWRRPSLTALEILWRWAAAAPLLALAAWEVVRVGRHVVVNWSALQAMTVFRPVQVFGTIDAALSAVLPTAKPVVEWLLPLAVVVWIVVGALGRAVVLRRLDKRLRVRVSTLLALGTLRTVVLLAVWALWVEGVRWAGHIAITGPAQRGGEPSVVEYCALLICGTLGLFVAWATVSWVLHLAPLEAMLRGAENEPGSGVVAGLREALRIGRLRPKLIETNLVMGIVKIALLVLAMVFSACPLPFATVETQTFLTVWWCCVGLVYLAAQDYFHVVRAQAYLTLWRAYETQAPKKSI